MGMLEGKVGAVTGSGSGIGRATAQRMAEEGAAVVVADINLDAAKETVQLIEATGGRAVAQWVDVAEEDAIAAMVQAAVDTFGGLQLLHNNAADVVIIQRDLDVIGMDVEVWDRTMAVNLRGAMLGCKHALPRMLEAGGGAIVNTSSCAGQFGDLERVAYGVSKAGIDSLTRYVATLYGKRGIRCNAIAPGPIFTPSLEANVPAEQLDVFIGNLATPYAGRPTDIANMVVYLCSDQARFVTGQVYNVDGGMVMHTPTFAQLAPTEI
ncbi:MAG TPA: SDR family oxidoreductase [Acidimicrobiales bacterium]|jgi:NAD(P)-dependent dehydrogenase (short-subunit alcohol dehydrogenase family)|nr:SDR family oxidoreductase [Acidimicrobiales bacterium]